MYEKSSAHLNTETKLDPQSSSKSVMNLGTNKNYKKGKYK